MSESMIDKKAIERIVDQGIERATSNRVLAEMEKITAEEELAAVNKVLRIADHDLGIACQIWAAIDGDDDHMTRKMKAARNRAEAEYLPVTAEVDP